MWSFYWLFVETCYTCFERDPAKHHLPRTSNLATQLTPRPHSALTAGASGEQDEVAGRHKMIAERGLADQDLTPRRRNCSSYSEGRLRKHRGL
jgi:hypothetical protein